MYVLRTLSTVRERCLPRHSRLVVMDRSEFGFEPFDRFEPAFPECFFRDADCFESLFQFDGGGNAFGDFVVQIGPEDGLMNVRTLVFRIDVRILS